MGHHSEAFIGIDKAKLRNAVAVAEAGRDGEMRYLGAVDTSEAATRKLVAGLAAKHRKLTLCYEAGPTGYGLQRLTRASVTLASWWRHRSFRRKTGTAQALQDTEDCVRGWVIR